MSLAHLLPLQMEQMIAIRVMTQSRLHLQFTMLRLKPILQSKRTVSDTKQHGELYDSSTTLIGSGGNPLVPPGGNQTASSSNPGSFGNITIIEKKLCLAVGCYDFIIYDDWGDGMEGSSQISCATDGNYTITTQTGFVLDNLQNVNFGNSEINNFCVAEDAGIESIALLNFDIYPNPSSGDDIHCNEFCSK